MRLIILLALVVGVLYCLHLLLQDYRKITASRFLRFFSKRDLSNPNLHNKPYVRWKRILHHDPLQCARFLYCDLGATDDLDTEVKRGFVYMLTLDPTEENKEAIKVFKTAYSIGMNSTTAARRTDRNICRDHYKCPFQSKMLFQLIDFLLKNSITIT